MTVFEGNSNLLAAKLITIVVAVMIAIKKIKLKFAIVIAMVASNRPVRPFKDSKSVWPTKKNLNMNSNGILQRIAIKVTEIG